MANSIDLPPKATGYVALGLIVLLVIYMAAKKAKDTVKDVAATVGLISDPEQGTPVHVEDPADKVAGLIVSPGSGTVVFLDDWFTPQYPLTVRIVANKPSTVIYSIRVEEDPPYYGGNIARTYGPYTVQAGPTPTLVPHMIDRLSSMLQGTPLATATLTLGGNEVHTVVYEVGT